MPPIRLGILVPSSNTALEPLTAAIVAPLGSDVVTVHFARFPVTEISLSAAALAQFSTTDTDGHGPGEKKGEGEKGEKGERGGKGEPPVVAAARLLADAHVDAIGWSGTSGGWLGFDVDEELCRAVAAAATSPEKQQELGGEGKTIPATTSTLALNVALRLLGAERGLALVTPYTDDVQEAIIRTYAAAGFRVVNESHLGVSRNHAIAPTATGAVLDAQVADIMSSPDGPELDSDYEQVRAVSTFCTNLVAADRAAAWEEKYGVIVLDTVSTVIWELLRMTNVPMDRIRGWGKLFELK
ncbi:Asp/Glu racemase [Xylariaceae sp. FL0804]|nr:Asp/Glu racemase [Xylariaceae sp. FL0804]